MKLITKRLILRQPTRKDISDIAENLNNLNVSKWLSSWPYPYTKKDAKNWVKLQVKETEKNPRKDYTFGIELKDEKKLIGCIFMRKVDGIHKRTTLGYWLGEKYWRYGYGSESLKAVLDFAFKKLKLRRIEAGIYPGNTASGKLLEKYGFKKEGVRRKAYLCKADGKVKDEILYGLLRKDYKIFKRK